MTETRDIFAPDDIVVGDRLRGRIDDAAVESLAESIRKIGLQTPITVRWDKAKEAPILIAGLHRLEACKRLGLEMISCIVFSGNDTQARMWEIAENLHRVDLTVVERAEHIAEWMKLQLAQVEPIESKRSDGRGHRHESGIRAASRELGIERNEGQRAAKIASLPDETREQARNERWSQTRLLDAARERDGRIQYIDAVPSPEEIWSNQVIAVWERGTSEWRSRFLERFDIFARAA